MYRGLSRVREKYTIRTNGQSFKKGPLELVPAVLQSLSSTLYGHFSGPFTRICLIQVKIKFRLKFFKIGWFTISLCLLALTIHELGLQVGDKGNWESTEVKNNFNLHKTFWLAQLGQLGQVETIRARAKVLAQDMGQHFSHVNTHLSWLN